jgi:hypothetical protein
MNKPVENTKKNLPTDVRDLADQIIDNLSLEGYVVTYDAARRALQFKKELKEASVPLALVIRNQWADVRQIFHAVFESGPQVENFGAPNEWSRGTVR